MNSPEELAAIARGIVGANLYMVLGTADEDGRPWVSPSRPCPVHGPAHDHRVAVSL